jgi:hypothetical protein
VPDALVTRLHHNPKLIVSAPRERAIAGGIESVSVDMHVSRTAALRMVRDLALPKSSIS